MRSRIIENSTRENESAGVEKGSAVSVNENEIKAKVALKNAQSLLMKGLAIPCLLCLQECGRSGWLILSVGSIFCYILDLIRSAEGTLVSIFLTLLVFASVLLYSLSEVLEESWMNFPLLPAYCTIVIFTFIFCASHFTVVFQDMNNILHVSFQVMFATLPLVASSIISVYLCEEVSAFELPVVFSCVYAVYLFFFGFPRVNYIQEVIRHRDAFKVKRSISYTERAFIHPVVLEVMCMLAIPLSLLLSFSLHYNIPLTSRQASASVMQSVLLPTLLVTLCMKSHLPHHTHLSQEDKERRRSRYDRSLAVVAGSLGVNMIDHPILDDVRVLGELDEDTASLVFTALIAFSILSYIFIRRIQAMNRQAEELSQGSTSSVWGHVYRVCSLVSTSTTAGLLSLLIGMPYKALPLFILGSAGLSEMYFQPWSPLYRLCLGLLSSAAYLLALPYFFKNNIYNLLFNWAWHVDLSMQKLCQLLMVLLLIAAFLPALLSNVRSSVVSALPTAIAPQLGGDVSRKGKVPLELRIVFALGLCVFSTVIAGLELLVLEQEWGGLNMQSNHIYPEYFFAVSAILLTFVSYKLYRKKLIGMPTVLVVCCLHALKFLHYAPMPSANIFAIASLVTTCLLPFVRQLSEYKLRDDAHEFEKMEATETSYISLTNAELLFFVALNTVSTFYSGRRVARLVLRIALSKAPVFVQTIMFSVAIYLFFISMVLMVFMKQQKWLRSVLFAAGAVLLILSLEGFGSLSFAGFSAPSSNDDHSFAFTLLSSAMTVVAWTQTVPLASITSCFIYSVIFGFASTKAMLGWVLPETPVHNLSHNVFGFPFLALYIGKASSTFLVLWGSKDKLRHPLFPVLLVVAVLWPVVAYLLSRTAGYPPALGHGIMWSTIVSTASTCASFRAQEVLVFLRGSRTTHALTFKQSQISLILLMAVLCLSWTVLTVASESSAIDSDVLFPAAALLILCEDASFLPYKQHPFTLWTKIVAIWWYISVLYHIFFRGMGESVLPGLPPYSLFGWDEEVSIWVLDSSFLPLLNLFMAFVPLPALYASTRQGFFSEEILFVLALISVAPIIGGSIDCVRYLGLLGVAAAGYACYTKSVGTSKAKHSVI